MCYKDHSKQYCLSWGLYSWCRFNSRRLLRGYGDVADGDQLHPCGKGGPVDDGHDGDGGFDDLQHELVAAAEDRLVVLPPLFRRHLLQVVPGREGRTFAPDGDATNLSNKFSALEF